MEYRPDADEWAKTGQDAPVNRVAAFL
jgi:hypothetical protein